VIAWRKLERGSIKCSPPDSQSPIPIGEEEQKQEPDVNDQPERERNTFLDTDVRKSLDDKLIFITGRLLKFQHLSKIASSRTVGRQVLVTIKTTMAEEQQRYNHHTKLTETPNDTFAEISEPIGGQDPTSIYLPLGENTNDPNLQEQPSKEDFLVSVTRQNIYDPFDQKYAYHNIRVTLEKALPLFDKVVADLPPPACSHMLAVAPKAEPCAF
jgi:hypothetical protein